MALIGADYNRFLSIYKMTRFSYWVKVVVEGGLMQNFELKSNKCEQEVRVDKFWLFFENVIIEYPPFRFFLDAMFFLLFTGNS